MAEEEEHSSALEVTPTWAVATVCFVLIFISIFLEHLLHLVAKYLHRTKRKSLLQALDNIKSELMMLGFLSLLLTAGEKPISSICIPIRVSETFLPCPRVESSEEEEETTCQSQGKMSLMSQEGVRQLNYLIFVFALFHCLSCIFTFGLGMAKMRKWASWEAETKTLEYHFSNDPRRFRLAHQTSFAKRHLTCWTDQWMLRGPAIFLRQFYKSVSRVDYLTLRHGFITTHLSEGSKFDFQKYIERALEKDFGVVVGMSLWVWMFSIIFIFFHAHGFYNYVWLPFFPLVMLLCVGTKLQGIITKMGLESRDKSHVVRGRLVVRPSDHFFWFGRPKLILYLIHFILFQNSFQLAFFIWTWYKFGFKSCFHQTVDDIVIRLVMGVLVQILCGYVTLPLYALVTQMGSSMRDAVFTQNVTQGLKKWRATAKKNLAQKKQNSASRSNDPSRNTSSPASILHGCRASSMAVELHPPSDQQFIQIKMEGDEDTRQQQDNKTSTG